MSWNDREGVIIEGWLTKSPEEKHIWKKRWKEKYCVLRQGDIPGQYILEYFSDAKKQKRDGYIDLDECDQVDSGLCLKFASGGKSLKNVFDLKIRHREGNNICNISEEVFYLAAATSEDMNQWVACICGVCGLRMRDELPPERVENRYSPQPSRNNSDSLNVIRSTPNGQPQAQNTIIRTPPSSCRTDNNNHVMSISTVSPLYDQPRGVPSIVASSEGPYVRLRDCETGWAKDKAQIRKVGHQPSDLYDQPKSVIGPSELYYEYNGPQPKPRPTKSKLAINSPPPVNYDTFPRGDVSTSSVRSCPDSQEVQRSRLTSSKDLSALYAQPKRSVTPNGQERGNESYTNVSEKLKNSLNIVPPRPPKPDNISRSKSKSESSALHEHNNEDQGSNRDTAYDIPCTQEETKISSNFDVKEVSATSLGEPLYCFPRRSDDPLNVTVPVPKAPKLNATAKHPYTNGPTGVASAIDFVFTYEYKPSLPTTATDDQIITGNRDASVTSQDGSQVPQQPERSPRTPNSGLSENTPPAVDRNLKPKKKNSESDAPPSPTTNNMFHLHPAPINKRGFSSSVLQSTSQAVPPTKSKSTSKMGEVQGFNESTQPRTKVASHMIHTREASTSEDDTQTARETKRVRPGVKKPSHIPENAELNYLDLFQSDSQNSSPRSPHDHDAIKSNLLNSPVKTISQKSSTQQPINLPKDTVYKTVDWDKTTALTKVVR